MTNNTGSNTMVTAEVASAVAQFLTPVVRNLIALAINTKQAHWHLRGPNFLSLHEYLDTVQQHAVVAYDEAAERIVALGLPVDARITSVAAKATNPVFVDGFQQQEVMLTEVLAQVDATLDVVQAAVAGLDGIDAASQDIAIGINKQLQQDRWFLRSHLSV